MVTKVLAMGLAPTAKEFPTMETFANFWASYAICYAIGFMLFIRPKLTMDSVWIKVFYGSLLIFSTITFIVKT